MTSAAAPEVSVVVPTHNVAPFIGAAIESILAQNFGDFEVILMDDGSSDSTVEVARRFDDDRLNIVPRRHRGPTRTMNEAIELARGRWIAFLDGDDMWAPDKLRRHVEVMNARPGLDMTFCRSRMVNEEGQNLPIKSPRWKGSLRYEQLLVSNPAANGSSIVARRQALMEAGCFDNDFAASYDYDLWLRLALLRPNNIACIPEVLTYYRRRSGQITADPSIMEDSWKQLIEKHRQLNPETVNALEPRSRSNLYRYLAAIAYEAGQPGLGLSYMRRSLSSSPRQFLFTARSYVVSGALLVRRLFGN